MVSHQRMGEKTWVPGRMALHKNKGMEESTVGESKRLLRAVLGRKGIDFLFR